MLMTAVVVRLELPQSTTMAASAGVELLAPLGVFVQVPVMTCQAGPPPAVGWPLRLVPFGRVKLSHPATVGAPVPPVRDHAPRLPDARGPSDAAEELPVLASTRQPSAVRAAAISGRREMTHLEGIRGRSEGGQGTIPGVRRRQRPAHPGGGSTGDDDGRAGDRVGGHA